MEVGAEGLKLSHFIVQIKLESQKKKKKKITAYTAKEQIRGHTHTHTQGPTAGLLQQVLATWASGKLRRRRSRRRGAPPSKPELH